ncbi:MAG: aldo/keto reductase, partial [Bacteroidota bacterium]
EVSAISYGCMSLPPDQSLSSQLLHRACDLGINFFDTADLYQKGFNEQMLGHAFKDRRQQLLIATKVGNQWRSDGSGWDWNPTKAYILQAVEQSLRRLQTDYIDLYQLHGGTIDDPMDESIEAFEQLKAKGYIRAYGISSIRPNVIRAYAAKSQLSSVMMQYSLLDRRPEESCLALLEEKNIGVIVRGGIAKGLLGHKAAKEYLSHTAEEVGRIQKRLGQLSVEERSPAQTALRFALAQSAVSTVATGASRVEQLEENAATLSSPELTKEEWQALRELSPAHVYQKHR